MDKFPGPRTSKPEGGRERVLSSQEILDAISQYAEGYVLGRELSDDKGVYLLEVTVEGAKVGDTIEYQYMRKGNHANQNASDTTVISIIYYEDGMPVGGERIADFNEETGEWRKL